MDRGKTCRQTLARQNIILFNRKKHMKFRPLLILLVLCFNAACQVQPITQAASGNTGSPEFFVPSVTTALEAALPGALTTPTAISAIWPNPGAQSSPTPGALPSPTQPSPTPSASPSPTPVPITTLLFTGVIVPARCVQAALDVNGNPDYPYEEVRETISQADLAVGSFNATMSERVEHTGCTPTYQLVGSPANADALQNAGFDLMSVATNHIKDCGSGKAWCNETFFDTLDNLKRVGILTVGAGANQTEALQPVVVTLNGIRFGFVSLGDSKQDESVFAQEDWPGIAYLSEENLRTAIAAARQVSDVVIALPHWGSEDIVVPNWIQRTQARQLIEAGADIIVGNHTHVVQALQDIDGVPVFYGLGNFVFDQGLRDHRQGAILLLRFEGTRYLGYEIIPTHVDPDGRVHIAGEQEAAEIMQRVEEASQVLR